MLAEARRAAPLEACGLLFGRVGSRALARFQPITNVLRSERAYELDAQEYLEALFAAEAEGLEMIGVMHSHPASPAYPSAVDVAGASSALVPDDWHWVVISLHGAEPVLRSFLIVEQSVVEEEIEIVEDR